MDLSEILLYLELIKKEKKRKPLLKELNMMLYFLEDYDQVEEFYNKLIEKFTIYIPFRFLSEGLIHFIEDYEACVNLKDKILQTSSRKYSMLFMHQILLSETKEHAISIIKEAKEFKVELGEEWTDNYDSMCRIKKNQEEWRRNIIQFGEYNLFSKIYEDFYKMKLNYFESLSLNQLKDTLLEKQTNKNNRKITQTTVYDRSVYIKEFARKVAVGICQLCEKEAPFLDKQGNPFLEVHHIHYLSKGGRDSIDNVVAICPNCHRKIHHLELEEDIKKIAEKALANMIV